MALLTETQNDTLAEQSEKCWQIVDSYEWAEVGRY